MKQLFLLLFSLSCLCVFGQVNADTLQFTNNVAKDTATLNNHFQHSALSFNGQITAWSVFQFAKPVNTQFGGRFVPTLTGFHAFSEKSKLDFEASLNVHGALNWNGTRYDTTTHAFKPYRVWLRYSGDNWEVRGGLQKINFGSAKLFRPLMWFDEMDVRDPLQLTDGVYGVLGKYFFANNANVWLWSLIGNKNRKGFELMGSAPWTPEIGGRVETPLGPGELAFSTHFRKADVHSLFPLVPEKTYVNEKRFGLDGKWDVGVGLWFESSVSIFNRVDYDVAVYNDLWNVGADYTLPIGSGVGVTLEYFRYHVGDKIWSGGQTANLLGAMFTYPVSILDNVSAMFFYVKEADKLFNYVSYSRTYDKWNIYLIGFWNPEINLPMGGQMSEKNLFMGKGVQVMVGWSF